MFEIDEQKVESKNGELVLSGAESVMALSRSEIDSQIATAKQYPRSVKKFINDSMTLATLDADIAGSMFYALPRAGKNIQGPSVRLAEVVVAAYGNIRADADIVAIDDTHVTAMGTCHDLEKNTAIRVRVKRRITNKAGKRFNDDMITVASNAACAIAFRQAVFKVIPFALVKPVYQAAMETSVGTQKTLKDRRDAAFAWFKKMGVSEGQLLKKLDKAGIADVDMDCLITLTGFRNAIKDNELTLDEFLKGTEEVESEGAKELQKKLIEQDSTGNDGKK